MPELPEVESIKLGLQKYLKGHTVESIEIKSAGILQGDKEKLVGGKFKEARRFGKVVVVDFDNGYSFLAHVKLTGQFIYRGPNLSPAPKLSPKVTGGLGGKHTHVIFDLSRDGKLYYNDVRKFGWIKIVKTSDVKNNDFIKKLGPEPLGELTVGKLADILRKTRRAVKVVIMDQSKMGGVGNIYANDALYLANINPKRSAMGLTEDEIEALFGAIEEVLRRGLKWGGASELNFVTPDGTEGLYQNHTLVYGKAGKPCKRCAGKIQKFTLSGRGTYWCPNCQK